MVEKELKDEPIFILNMEIWNENKFTFRLTKSTEFCVFFCAYGKHIQVQVRWFLQ